MKLEIDFKYLSGSAHAQRIDFRLTVTSFKALKADIRTYEVTDLI